MRLVSYVNTSMLVGVPPLAHYAHQADCPAEASAVAESSEAETNLLLEVKQMNRAIPAPADETERFADDIEFIRLREVKRITGMGTTYIYEKVKAGDFPGQIKLGPRAVAWIKAEVLAWAREQVARTRGDSSASSRDGIADG